MNAAYLIGVSIVLLRVREAKDKPQQTIVERFSERSERVASIVYVAGWMNGAGMERPPNATEIRAIAEGQGGQLAISLGAKTMGIACAESYAPSLLQ